MNFYGFIALLIGLSIWAFVIFAVVIAIRSEIKDNRDEKEKKITKKPSS